MTDKIVIGDTVYLNGRKWTVIRRQHYQPGNWRNAYTPSYLYDLLLYGCSRTEAREEYWELSIPVSRLSKTPEAVPVPRDCLGIPIREISMPVLVKGGA